MLGFVTIDVIAGRNVPRGHLGRHQGNQPLLVNFLLLLTLQNKKLQEKNKKITTQLILK